MMTQKKQGAALRIEVGGLEEDLLSSVVAASRPRMTRGHAAWSRAAGPADLLDLPRPAPFYLTCPHCRFLCDRSKSECLACGLVFSKWSARQARPPQPEIDWAYRLIWVMERLAARPKTYLFLSAFLWAVWPAGDAQNSHAPVADIYSGPWHEAGGVRFRVSYLRPEGYYNMNGRGGAPQSLWGTYPVYHPDDEVSYRIELTNRRDAPLTGLRIRAKQEKLSHANVSGAALGETQEFSARVLSVGVNAVFTGRFKVSGLSNFEQTHLWVYADGLYGRQELVADVPWAGIVDPPIHEGQ